MTTRFIPSAAAAARLGVKRTSLYAYVSRGLLTAHSLPGHRGSWFDPVELDTLTTRAREPIERRPDLRVTSAVTLLEQGRYWYRGRAPEVLARERSFESVAEWLWTGIDASASPRWTTDDDDVRRARAALASLPKTASPAEQARLAITMLGATDPLRTDLRPAGALATARRLVANAAKALGGRRDGRVAEQVAAWVGVKGATPSITRAIEQALVIMADHELAASTLAVRVSASFGADPYAAVVAGLGPVSGARHGAASRRIELCLNAIARGERAPHAAARLLGGDDSVPGFGHPLYPAGDPRVDMLLPVARGFGTLRAADSLHRVATEQGAAAPNVDFALAALTHRLGLRVGAGEAIFTMGRLAGWLAHAIEEYTNRTAFRLRAVYTGPRPEA